MHSKINAVTIVGLNVHPVNVEIDIDKNTNNAQFFIVGLPSASIMESRKRVTTALKNCIGLMPEKRVVVNLSPADLKKDGTWFDLAIALGIMRASGSLNVSKYHNIQINREYNLGLMPICKNNLCINPEHLQLEKIRYKSIDPSTILEIKEKYESHSWSAYEISKHFNISLQIIWDILKGKRNQEITSSVDQMIINYDICKNCSIQHDNLGSEFCSIQCAQDYILKQNSIAIY